jgi:hypothetical protein
VKQFYFKLEDWQLEQFFSIVRSKQQVILLLMRTIKLMIVTPFSVEQFDGAHIVLKVSKMSRLFFFSKDKYFSISFPFLVTESDGRLLFSAGQIADVDSRVTSEVIAVISAKGNFDQQCALGFVEPIVDIADNRAGFWPFLLGLFLFEDGYIRYDFDEDHQNGELHPLNHYDVFYSSNATFKIGLHNKINKSDLVDLVDAGSNCHFIQSADVAVNKGKLLKVGK